VIYIIYIFTDNIYYRILDGEENFKSNNTKTMGTYQMIIKNIHYYLEKENFKSIAFHHYYLYDARFKTGVINKRYDYPKDLDQINIYCN